MRIRQTVIVPVILALGAAGSILASSTVPAAAAQAPASHVLATASHATPKTFLRG